ncbi:hypothetical protein JQS43_08825 [Natronosporangium hydrolyticum]|uniref:Uncharacterized protein n=1 Tax=Natronosporangium hydrolyticum TaxID=2811111 RepID=A0A895YNS7_9ACTN|nr:hypothetical protein [Natronosporangium hydrolyticum]QSB16366.1 hypothetical protein JQS43_08825 [Natronosporangium hydrolyticum]
MSKQRTANKSSGGMSKATGKSKKASGKQHPASRRGGRYGGRGRTGFAGMRRTRTQRLGIAAVALVALALIWLFVEWQLAIGLSALVLLVLPAFVVLTMGRRY